MIKELFSLNNKTAFLSGSSQGLGFRLARGMGKAGATVILNGRDAAKVDSSVKALKSEGITTYGVIMDVSNEADIIEKKEYIDKNIGHIDILINNAGIQKRGPLEDIALKDWQKVLDINLTAAFVLTKHFVKPMIAKQKGKIINTCSLMSELGRETTGPYTAAKGGLKMLTKAMAVEWAHHNIQVNGIGPGYFISEMTQPLADNPAFDSWLKKRTPAQRWGELDELIGTAIFLASEASSFINGQIIYVDGGITASL